MQTAERHIISREATHICINEYPDTMPHVKLGKVVGSEGSWLADLPCFVMMIERDGHLYPSSGLGSRKISVRSVCLTQFNISLLLRLTSPLQTSLTSHPRSDAGESLCIFLCIFIFHIASASRRSFEAVLLYWSYGPVWAEVGKISTRLEFNINM